MTQTNKIETHKKAAQYAACNLIEVEIPTRAGPGSGVDLILNSGKTIHVSGMRDELAVMLMTGSLDQLKADYLIIATRQRYTYSKKIYIMTMDEAKEIAVNDPSRMTGNDQWFIEPSVYQEYRENYDVLA
jgi:hypothetical protein